MNRPLLAFAALTLVHTGLGAQQRPRAIRRTIPITWAFQRGLALGTRDSSGRPTSRYWQLRADYQIQARLDPATASVTGRETVTVTNPSDSALEVIVLRLYQNHFSANVARSDPVPEITEGIHLSALAVNGQPIDSGEVRLDPSRTVARVKLTTPIAPGASWTLEAAWSFRVPNVPGLARGGERMGRWDQHLYQVAQWYPQVAVYDDLRGWNDEGYLGNGEFYNNFGSFDVRLDLPGGWLAGATGQLLNPGEVLSPWVRERLSRATASDSQIVIVGAEERGPGRATPPGDRLEWHFHADSVADFAWAASPEFVWDATRATIPDHGSIPIHLLYLPEHTNYRNTGAFARHAIEFYSRMWMPYAWSQFTQVDGPEGGMEYPMLTMSGPGFGVTDHEIGHQWWPMMVGNDETWYGWMDEGFNQYMNILSRADFDQRPPVLDSLGQQYGRISGNEAEPSMMWNANYDGRMYGFVTYGKTPMMFSMLGGMVGDSAVAAAMQAYARLWRFKHPSPWDFMFALSRQLGRDLDWFWYYWLFTTESSDGRIANVETRGSRTTVTVYQDGEMPAPVVLRVEFAAGGPAPKPMKNAVINGRAATVTWPVDVWFGGRRSFAAELDFGKARIERIQLDPGGRFPDRDVADNVWPRVPSP
jgi:Peptidase family M1 domain